ncbi:ammonia-forming cytochrome c nitrite reductase subunit c552 [Sporomusa aerivorans]|uniref:ammonia-forming cytochrome c nitrite reductase subunit c552 n=1 Tax=Sporomusa aerivorans TaxID=204936 RepID=UPI00352A1073
MNKTQKILTAFLVLAIVFAGVVISRVWLFKPQSTVKLVKIPAGEYDTEVWGKNYPLQYAGYQKSMEMTPSPTGYGGGMKVQKAEMQPELYINFKGNPFSKDYTEDRGHPYAMEDLRESKRIGPAAKAACITCKTPYIEQLYKEQGWGYANQPLLETMEKAKHPINCANCHDPETMGLRVINPAFIEGMQRRGIDITKASREEMRSYVCAQCHSEYYFEPGTFKVIFPWDKGLTPQQMYEYYATKPNGFAQDFVHPDSGVPVLKAQHPDYEEWQNGVHGQFGVSCADCHMPYMRKSGQKYSSHWITSPLKNIEESCSPCHTQGKELLFSQVKAFQDNVWQLQHTAGQQIAKAHTAIQKASTASAVSQTELANARELLRRAQWYWDYVAASNSMGFHNPVQELNTLGQAIDLSHQSVNAANRAAGTNTL